MLTKALCSNDYVISSATFVDCSGNDFESFAAVKNAVEDAGSSVYGDTVTFMVVYDYDTGVASYVFVTSIA